MGTRLVATCSLCGSKGVYECSEKETENLIRYDFFGREAGKLQDLFPNVPNWIRSGAIDKYSGGFCICPDCQ